MDDIDLDVLILSFASNHWQKSIDIIEQTLRVCAAGGIDPGARLIGDRINELVDDGQIEASAPVFDWRTTSVRLAQGNA
ncbi:MAG: hypothetical protein J2P54_21715 [Bradyrhizobiaceae bacterium]|nr:hypothetical protein [Bradyrhizobiaceae bacterium]